MYMDTYKYILLKWNTKQRLNLNIPWADKTIKPYKQYLN